MLLSVEQLSQATGLSVTGILGLPADPPTAVKHSEDCTWYLNSKSIEGNLVLQYTVYHTLPDGLAAYYSQVVSKGYGKIVPDLGDVSKIADHVLDTIYKKAEIHLTLRAHDQATPEDKAAAIQLMRLALPGIRQ